MSQELREAFEQLRAVCSVRTHEAKLRVRDPKKYVAHKPPSVVSAQRRLLIRRLAKEGATQKKMSAIVGISSTSIRKHLKRMKALAKRPS